MDGAWTSEERMHVKVVAIARLRKLKQALEGKKARLAPAEWVSVPRDYGEEFQCSLLELRRVGVDTPRLFSNRDVDQGDDDAVSGHQLLTRIDLVLDRIEAKPRNPPAQDS